MRKGQVEILLKKDGCKDIKVTCSAKIKMHPVAAFFAIGYGMPPMQVKPIDWKGVGIAVVLFFTIFLSCTFFVVSIAFGIIALGGTVALNFLYNQNYFSKYIQKKLREGYQVEDQEQRQILEEAGVLPLVEKPSKGFQLPKFSGLNVKKILSIAGGAIAVIFLLSLFFGGDPVDNALDDMETVLVKLEKLIVKLEDGKISVAEYESQSEEILIDWMEGLSYYSEEDYQPTIEQARRLEELGRRMDVIDRRSAAIMLRYYY